MKAPNYKKGDIVEFVWRDSIKIGQIYIVDEEGTFEQWEEPSYDIMVEDEGLYKHLRESLVRANKTPEQTGSMFVTYKVFSGKKSVSVPIDIMREYEEKVGTFTENTANYFMTVLELQENMRDDELTIAVVKAMKEDCIDSAIVKGILSGSKVNTFDHRKND